jgi:MinD superfamily P-loop ATPase containing an inserted ferredoxin domain
MAHRIYYFSGTGNSLWVARKISENLPDAELIPITEDLPSESEERSENRQDFKSIGLVFPVYMSRPPQIVVDFISKLPESKYIYAAATCGMMSGKVLSVLKKRFSETDRTLSAGYIIPLVTNFIVFPKTKSNAQIEKAFQKAEIKAQTIAKNTIKKVSQFDKETPGIIAKPSSLLLFNPIYRRIPKLDKQFSVNSKCNNCGTCRDVCPVRNIKITNEKPVFLHHCEMCFSCINWCPKNAINWTVITKNRKRYRCKGISKNDVVSNRYYKINESLK